MPTPEQARSRGCTPGSDTTVSASTTNHAADADDSGGDSPSLAEKARAARGLFSDEQATDDDAEGGDD